ncbi:MAG: hypothetical protein N3E37_04035, partial [Candidatus Micrarchaeota archaeon]|nr:hypothetical protein [Candidatus Micrarchaeota archaeon]
MANNENISKKNYFFGLSNNVFVSDYQNNLRIIDLGPIITGHHFFFSDYQELKSKSYYEILDLFSHHLRSYIRNEKTFHNIKELAMATNPAEIEITL